MKIENCISCFQSLVRALRDEPTLTDRLSIDPAPSLRWLHRSALQKAIRRGNTGRASYYAAHLLELDEPSLWRALATIAVEDVGQVELIGWTLGMSKKSFRDVVVREIGAPAEIIEFLVKRLCLAPKTRACCELSLAMDCAVPNSPMWGSCSQQSALELVGAIRGKSIFASYSALAVLRNRSPAWLARPTLGTSSEMLAVSMNAVSDLFRDQSLVIQETMRMCIEGPLDTMHLAAVPLIARLAVHKSELVEDDIPLSGVIAGIEAESYDMHTREGQLALSRFYDALIAIPGYLSTIRRIPRFKSVKALGSVLFVEEGGLVDVRLRSCWLDALRELQNSTFCTAWGVPADIVTDLREIVRAELPRLHDLREQVMTGQGAS